MERIRKESEIILAGEEELDKEDYELLSKARAFTARAYAPYSRFKVAAVLLLEDGTVVQGSNQENAAYPSGLCAERVALFQAGALYPDKKIKSIAITASSDQMDLNTPVYPCGACLQVMSETEHRNGHSFKIILAGERGKVLLADGVATFLPFRFQF